MKKFTQELAEKFMFRARMDSGRNSDVVSHFGGKCVESDILITLVVACVYVHTTTNAKSKHTHT